MKSLSYLVLLALISCGSSVVKKEMEDVSSYRTSGVEQFFLTQLPTWNNISVQGQCFKKSSFYYLDFSKLEEAYQLTYPEMIELQAQYNDRLETYFRSAAVRFVKPVEEASFFSNTLEQVRGGVRSLKIPEVNEVQVIWFEGLTTEEIKKIARSEELNEKLPILFSSCHSKQSLTQWLMYEKLDDVGFHLITAEWLSPFSSQSILTPGLRLELAELLNKKIKISVIKNQQNQRSELIIP
jgi:hypothetical protein